MVAASAAEEGRDLASFEWCVFVFVNIDTDGGAARETAARSIGGTYSRDVTRMVDRIAAAGTAADVASRLREFFDAGARNFVLCPATAGAPVEPMFSRLFDEVIPDLRAHAAAG